MPRISTDNYDTVASWNGSQDLFIVEQPDGTKVATPAMVKQYILNDMDEVPTQNSNKLVKSGGVFSAVDDVYSVMGQNGAKNLIPYPYSQSTYTANGITFTDNGDGTVTVNGTATNNTNFWCIHWQNDFISPEGNYILSAGGVGNSNVYLFFANYNNSTWKRQYNITDGGEIAVTVQHSGDYNRTPIGISVKSGTTVNNLTFKPMLRLASDTDNTYQPYAKTNRQLTEDIDDVPTQNSNNPVKSGGVKTYVDNAVATATTWTDISSRCTVDTTKVASFSAYTCGKIIYISLTLKVGVTDQSNVVTNLPQVIGYGVLPMFYMNVIDITSGGVCMYTGTTIQYRGNATQGANGTQYSGMFLLV